MSSDLRHVFIITALAIMVLASAAEPEAGRLAQVHEVATAHERPPGTPNRSDVCFSSRSKHPSNPNDPHDTFATAEAFEVTRYLWVYTSDAAFIREAKKTAASFQCALNSMLTDWPEGGRRRGRIMNLDGELVTASWMRTWKDPAWGCCNSPEWRESYLAHAKAALDAGADLFQMDDPPLNHRAMAWGGCFCPHCMEGFRAYVDANLSEEQCAELGIVDRKTFNYGNFLRAQGAPVGDAFGKWDGGELKALFGEFLKESVEQFYADMRARIDAHAGRRVTFSTNNYAGCWTFPYDLFDFGVAELPHRDVRPDAIYNRFRSAHERGKAQVFTLVSEDIVATRRVIATAYACGGHLLVPWDVFLETTPNGVRRYYGRPEDYADLYHFVRTNAALFDRYEDAAVVLPKGQDERYPERPPVTVSSAEHVCAFVRAVPNDPAAPVVIHLVDWSDELKPLQLQLDPERFAQGPELSAELVQPGKEPMPLKAAETDGRLALDIPALSPWAMVQLK